eukprot:gene7073-biopygen23987
MGWGRRLLNKKRSKEQPRRLCPQRTFRHIHRPPIFAARSRPGRAGRAGGAGGLTSWLRSSQTRLRQSSRRPTRRRPTCCLEALSSHRQGKRETPEPESHRPPPQE